MSQTGMQFTCKMEEGLLSVGAVLGFEMDSAAASLKERMLFWTGELAGPDCDVWVQMLCFSSQGNMMSLAGSEKLPNQTHSSYPSRSFLSLAHALSSATEAHIPKE